MIKKLIIAFVLLFGMQTYAQQGSISPYSFYGIGSLKFKGTVVNKAMGGLSVFKDSIHINLKNPATYGGNNLALYNNESRPVKFSVSGSHTLTNLKTNTSSNQVKFTTFDYLALSIPIGKFGFGFGLIPYTSVGYKLESNNAIGNINSRFEGKGGLNKAYLSAGYQLTKNLSVGVDAHYNFGSIENSFIEFHYNHDDELLTTQSRENNNSDLSGLNFNLGLHYKTMLNPDLELQSSITYSPKSTLVSKNTRSVSNITVSATTGLETVITTLDQDLKDLDKVDLTLPSRFSIGTGLGEPRHWFAGIEYTTQNTSSFSNPLYANAGSTFENASTLSIGGFFIPKYNSLSNYWNRVTYRMGTRFEKTGLLVENKSIEEFGMSFGVGLPVGNLFSNANIGIEVGRRGTRSANLIQENFINFQISLSLNDRWFIKRKYN